LITRARARDREAFDVLVAPLVDPLARLAGSIVLDRDLARDVLQDSLVLAWQRLPELREDGAFEAWTRRIVINTARNALRRSRRVQPILMAAPPDPVDGAADRVVLEAALRGLDASHRTVLALFYLEGRSVDDIAQVLGIPEGTVKSRLHSGRAKLRAAFEDEHGRP
jgi:RNA polymerase sigma-70 factor, ECF subfamily